MSVDYRELPYLGKVGHLDLRFVPPCVLLSQTNFARDLSLRPFALQRVLLIVPSKPPSSVTSWSSSTRQFSRDMCRVLSCYHPSESPWHSRPLYQRLGRNVQFRITIPYGYHFQKIRGIGGPPRPADAGVPVTTSQIRLWVLLD